MTERRIDAAIDIARAEREALRWLMLTALWHARPYGTREDVLLACAHEIPIYANAELIRRELGWLESHGLAAIVKDASPIWSVKLTALGEDVYEYRADAPAGLARPPRW